MTSGSAESEPDVAYTLRHKEADPAARQPNLIDSLVAAGHVTAPEPEPRLAQFLGESTIGGALACWFGSIEVLGRDEIVRRLSRDVAHIDALLNDQLNAILHHPALQRLEASWRGLDYLVRQVDHEGAANIKIRVLGVTWRELERDFERSVEFDQSQLFRKVYEGEFGTPGGEPLGVLLGDYEIHPRPTPEHPHDDVSILGHVAGVAAAAFCPFIASVSPAMFGLDHFTGLEHHLDLARTFEQTEYVKWRAFRDTEDARFVGLMLPRVLMRLPLTGPSSRVDRFCFLEDVSGTDGSKYLWGSAAFAFGEVAIRAFAQTGWLANIRGVERGVAGGGLVTGLPVSSFATDTAGVALKCSTDVVVTEQLEKAISDLGFVALCDCNDTEFSAFYSTDSVQKPKKYDRLAATMNARMSAMLQYMLCVSRFSHYLKVIARDKVGSFAEASECEAFLQKWVGDYVTADDSASVETKARYPLREARVQVREHPGKPGTYQCVIHLWPHFELDELSATVRVTTELAPGRPA